MSASVDRSSVKPPCADNRLDLGIEPLRDRGGVGDQRPSLPGVADDLGSAVDRVGNPFDVSEIFELRHELTDGILSDVLGSGDVGDPATLPAEKDHQASMSGP